MTSYEDLKEYRNMIRENIPDSKLVKHKIQEIKCIEKMEKEWTIADVGEYDSTILNKIELNNTPPILGDSITFEDNNNDPHKEHIVVHYKDHIITISVHKDFGVDLSGKPYIRAVNPIFKVFDNKGHIIYEYVLNLNVCNYVYNIYTTKLNNLFISYGRYVVKFNMDLYKISIWDIPHQYDEISSLVTQNKKNYLYAGSADIIYVLNIKSMNLLKTLTFALYEHYFTALYMDRDTLYLYYFIDESSGWGSLFVINNLTFGTNTLKYTSYLLDNKNNSITYHIQKYNNYLYLNGYGGIRVFDTQKKQFIKATGALQSECIIVHQHYLIVDNFYCIYIVNLKSHPDTKVIDFKIIRPNIIRGETITQVYNNQVRIYHVHHNDPDKKITINLNSLTSV